MGQAVLTYPFDLSFQRQQPLVFLGPDVFTRTRGPEGPAALVSALGVVHPLRPLGPARTLAEQHRRLNRPEARRLIQVELTRLDASRFTDALAYFVDYLAPAFAERDWGEGPRPEASLTGERPAGDWSLEIDRCGDAVPLPEPPTPSLWMCGRAWLLREKPLEEGRLGVRWGTTTLGLTGEYRPVATLAAEWQAAAQRYFTQAAAGIREKVSRSEAPPVLAPALEELTRTGCVRRGDLLFLPGTPPRLGHVIPAHYNRVLGVDSRGDLAMTAPLLLPPELYALCVYRRSSTGGWNAFMPPHGLCLGSGPPEAGPESPGLRLAAYLRWAAQRIASNGIFHSSDDAHNDY
jgi:hypothetical protein